MTTPDPMQAEIAEALMIAVPTSKFISACMVADLREQLASRNLTIVPLRAQEALIEALEGARSWFISRIPNGSMDQWTSVQVQDLHRLSDCIGAALRLARSPSPTPAARISSTSTP